MPREKPHIPATCPHHARSRGGAYLMLLGIMAIIITIGVGAIATSRALAHASTQIGDAADARFLAQSAVELGRLLISQDPRWRSNRTNGYWITNQACGDGTLSLYVYNPSGDLDHSDNDPVVLIGTGTKGIATQNVQVTLTPMITPLTCLTAAASSQGTMTFNSSSVNTGGALLASNTNIVSIASNLVGDLVSLLFSGSGLTGKSSSLTTTLTMPSSTLFDTYQSLGTPISVASLPTSGSTALLQQILLSPASNPYGPTNSSGIYVIDCQNRAVRIRNLRVVGTLVLLNVGSGSQMDSSVRLTPAVSTYPSLLIQGDFTISISNNSLSEGSGNINYNPAGTPYPYPSGSTNSTTSDQYPSSVTGPIYVSGNCTLSSANANLGILTVGGRLTVNSTNLNLTYDPAFYSSPAPGFYAAPMLVSPNSFKPTANN